ncbi:MAG TPA: phosphatase PAP2 family protein [Candidatus Limnocylindria bacterium]|nr:phosphatase PAP2 family protein [Candidatus Limnocylindria bacterium]
MKPARRMVAWTGLIVAAAAFLVAALWVPDGPSEADLLDPVLREAIPGWLGAGLDALNLLGGLPAWIALVVLAAALVWSSRRLVAAVIGSSILIEALTTVVRIAVDRPRPPLGVNTELIVAAGFPSGHVARSVVFMAAVLVVLPWARRHRPTWLAISILVVGLMCLARIHAAAHYASDTLAGVLVAAALVAAWSLLRDPEAEAESEAPRGATGWAAREGQREVRRS